MRRFPGSPFLTLAVFFSLAVSLTATARAEGLSSDALADGPTARVDPDLVAHQPGEPLVARGFTPCTVELAVLDGQGLSASTGNPVRVAMSANVLVSAVSVSVSDEPDLLTGTGCSSLVPGFDCSASETNGDVVVELTSSSGALVSSPGSILEIAFSVDPVSAPLTVTLTPADFDVTDSTGATCSVSGSSGTFVVTTCGNGILEGTEECDDGNDDDSDCCAADCRFSSSSTPCDDGSFCTSADHCDGAGACAGGPPIDCGDGVGCTADTCDEAADACVHAPLDSLCDNGSFCDGAESCDLVAGCQPGTPPCEDGIDCTLDACDEASDTCSHTPQDALCDDGAFCDGVETCDSSAGCVAGQPVDCNDGVSCTIDQCSETADACTHQAFDPLCSNGVFCDGYETCDAATGCQPGIAPSCDDGLACTIDSCGAESDSCENVPVNCPGVAIAVSFSTSGAPIWRIDANAQTAELVATADFAQGSSMARGPDGLLYTAGTPIIGSSIVPVDTLFTIDPVTLQTTMLGPVDLGGPQVNILSLAFSPDGVLYACRADVPIPYPPPPVAELWTIDLDTLTGTQVGVLGPLDSYAQGLAFSNDGVLYAWNVITGLRIVNPATGSSVDAGPIGGGTGIQTILFDDQNTLYAAGNGLFTINPGTGLVTQVLGSNADWRGAEFLRVTGCLSDANCNDGLFCNGVESCSNGACVPGTPLDCADEHACTLDTCDEALDACVHAPDDALCDDGLFCNGPETCDASAGCTAGTPPCPAPQCDEEQDTCPSAGVPTLGEWGLALLGLLLLAAGVFLFGRRHLTP